LFLFLFADKHLVTFTSLIVGYPLYTSELGFDKYITMGHLVNLIIMNNE